MCNVATCIQPDMQLGVTGASIGKVLLKELRNHEFDVSYCVGCGFYGAAAMASERVGAAAAVKKADYFHCCVHSFNLSVSQSLKIPELRHCSDCI